MTPPETGAPVGRVLVVDDSESNRYVLATWLRRAGHQVREARTGTEALAAVDSDAFDLIVLDVNLPDVGGFDVCEAIKARRAIMPVLHVSATAVNPADRSEGLRRGADGYLVEPVAREELIATVEALLRGAEAQRTALRLARRLRQLNDATLGLYEATSVETLVDRIVSGANALFDSGAAVALEVDGLTFFARRREGGAVVQKGAGAGAVDALLAEDGAGVMTSLDGIDGQRGVIRVDRGAAAEAEETEVVLAQFARAANVALKNIRSYDVERRIALTLQRSLLPDDVPELPDVQIATRYEASAQHAEVGGDFYEIFALGPDRIALAIGDVVGHSLEAAAVMAQLRTAIRSYLLEGHGPAATLDRLNRLLCRFHPGTTATACCAVYDVGERLCELANAGHPPPLLVTASGPRYLPFGGPLLGIEAAGEPATSFRLAIGDLLVFYTDGLIERRDRSIDEGFAELARVAGGPWNGMDELCEGIIRDVAPRAAVDDIALVAIRPL